MYITNINRTNEAIDKGDPKMKQTLNVFKNKTKREIPIFFATDDNYIPFLDIAVSSLLDNASKDFKYTILVL